jgi:hypothetical protein
MYKLVIAIVLGLLILMGQVLYVYSLHSQEDVRTFLELCLDYEGGKSCYKRDCEFYRGKGYCDYKERIEYGGGRACNDRATSR